MTKIYRFNFVNNQTVEDGKLTAARANDNVARKASLQKIKKLIKIYPIIEIISANDPSELHV